MGRHGTIANRKSAQDSKRSAMFTKYGRQIIVAAKAGVNGHISIGDGCQIAGTSGVVKSLPAGSIVVGTPAESQREFMARLTLPKRVMKQDAKIKELEAEIAALKKSLASN